MTTEHPWKGFMIRRAKTATRGAPLFHIYPHFGRNDFPPVAATASLRLAKQMINLWEEYPLCPCGRLNLPYQLRCQFCTVSFDNTIHKFDPREEPRK